MYDSGADASLKALSQPLEYASYDAEDMPGYLYPASAGKGITVYIIDTGADPKHKEFTDAPGQKRWIHINEDDDVEENDTGAGTGHGTCIQSLVNGPRFGAAKDADIVIVRLPAKLKTSYLVGAFYFVAEDIETRNLQGKAVVTSSILARKVLKDDLGELDETMREQMERLISLDVPVVLSAGNDRPRYKHIDSIPAAYASEMDIIAVGAMELNGRRTAYSQGTIDDVTVLAPGTVQCAMKDSTSETAHRTGASVAVPRVAGMIATWLSSDKYRDRLQVKGKVAANVKTLLKELAYAKMPASDPDGGFPAAYNGFGMFTCSRKDGKRAMEGGICGFASTSTALPSSTSMPPTSSTRFTTVTTTTTTAQPLPTYTASDLVYKIKRTIAGGKEECFRGSFDMNGRVKFVYRYTVSHHATPLILHSLTVRR
ncbi:peptidase S8/S53 domain-containing protein [Colletotrichum cereale]|nr:peptidase S8/S53 domain-containing protein [Colletotrichum cereale]